MKELARISALLTVVAICAWPSRANLIALDSSFGPGTLIEDTDTQLEWLKLTVTVDRSFNDISSQLGAGGEFAGFQYGSVVQVGQLFKDGGLPSIVPSATPPFGRQVLFSQNPSDLAATANLLNLFGTTDSVAGFSGDAEGLIANHDLFGQGPNEVDFADLTIQIDFACAVVNCAIADPAASAAIGTPTITVQDVAFPFAGSFLFRSVPAAVPEPSTMVLMPTGLAMLAIMRALRRRARAKVAGGKSFVSQHFLFTVSLALCLFAGVASAEEITFGGLSRNPFRTAPVSRTITCR